MNIPESPIPDTDNRTIGSVKLLPSPVCGLSILLSGFICIIRLGRSHLFGICCSGIVVRITFTTNSTFSIYIGMSKLSNLQLIYSFSTSMKSLPHTVQCWCAFIPSCLTSSFLLSNVCCCRNDLYIFLSVQPG